MAWRTRVGAALALILLASPAWAQDGQVRLPLAQWEGLQAELEAAQARAVPPIPVCPIERRIEGSFRKGLLRATLVTRFAYLDEGRHTRVPIVDGAASLGDVLLDGRSTSLLREGDMYTLGVDRAGVHEVRLTLFWGKEQDRFARRLLFRLPPAGPTRVSVLVPEHDIEARFAHGALTAERDGPAGTALEGWLDPSGQFDLSWSRRLGHRDGAAAAARTEARVYGLFTIQEALVSGLAVAAIDVLDGELDRLDFTLPEDVEVLKVEGDAVLQWRTDAAHGGRLTVLLRHLVEDHVRLAVHFQFPAEPGQPVTLRLPLPAGDVPTQGAVGIQGPAGLDVRVAQAHGAQTLTLRDLPTELSELTTSPLLLAFGFTAPPRIELTVARHAEVAVTSTLVDDLQASTVVIESGAEITKLRLRMRNNARQYLTMRLPGGAVLTHALVDGQPVRPAAPSGDALMFPLRQSERITAGEARWHTVRPGETLSDVANLYFSDPARWRAILEDNADELASEHDLYAGQSLRIPAAEGATVEESSFVIEVAYRRDRPPLGLAGRRVVELPEIDVDVLKATWHLYLPGAFDALTFDANLTQYSGIRYDPFRRARDFLRDAFVVRRAWAGGYESILARRKGIYIAEAEKKSGGEVVLASFPLVGERYRFKRVLLGRDTPRVAVTYVAQGVSRAARWAALGAGFGLLLWVLRRPSRRRVVAALGGLAVLLVLGHYVLGVHRRIVWGADLALVVALVRLRGRPWAERGRAAVREPWTLPSLVSGRAVVFVAVLAAALTWVAWHPLLLSSVALVLLAASWARAHRAVTAAAAALAVLLTVVTPARAGEEDWQEAQGAGDVVEDDAASAADADARAAQAESDFEAIMQQNAAPAPRAAPAAPIVVVAPSSGVAGPAPRVEGPLPEHAALREKVRGLREPAARDPGPAVVLGGASFSGEGRRGHLAITERLQVTLGHPERWKVVPLAGDDVVLAGARVGAEAIPVSRQNGYHVWVTREVGEHEVVLDLVVPARGPRGSIEYDFVVPRTPVTRFTCRFAEPGLEPRLDAAVQAEVTPDGGGTRLTATLRPTTRVHLVGFRDLGSGDAREARVYAETLNLLSVDESALELFTVIRYTILYAGAREFRVRIPAGMKVVSADGEGAFRYVLRDEPGGGAVLWGETEFPIRNDYEISLRLHREQGAESFAAPLPRCAGVEREVGWLAVEVPGKLKLEEEARTDVLAVDVRQLPALMVESTVSPILRAYRYHGPAAAVRLRAARLPEKDPASASIDRVRAFSVVSAEGRLLTDMRITLRNRLRHSLALTLPQGTEVRSTLQDGQPVKPSRDAEGRVMLPLRRSAGHGRLEPFTLQVVFEGRAPALGGAGLPELELPAVDLPVSSLAWSVYLPARNVYSALRGDVAPQAYVGRASWHQPALGAPGAAGDDAAVGGAAAATGTDGGGGGGAAGSADTGAMPVRIDLPESGVRLEYSRYWLEAGKPPVVRFAYLRAWLVTPVWLALAAAFAAGVLVAARRGGRLRRLAGGALALAASWPLARLGGGAGVALAVAAAGVMLAWRSEVVGRAPAAVAAWMRALGERRAARAAEARPFSLRRLLWRGVLAAGLGLAVLALLVALGELVAVLGTAAGG